MRVKICRLTIVEKVKLALAGGRCLTCAEVGDIIEKPASLVASILHREFLKGTVARFGETKPFAYALTNDDELLRRESMPTTVHAMTFVRSSIFDVSREL